MFLGINFDKWHGIIAAFGIAILFALYWLFTAPILAKLVPPLLNALAGWFIAAFIGFAAQCGNEIVQFFSDDVEDVYGSYRLFIQNSKQDFKYFWQGVAASCLLCGLFIWFFPL